MKSPYEILGIPPTASDDEVKQAYRALVRKYHPDKYRDSELADLATEKMKEINAAYEEIQKTRSAGSHTQNTNGYDYSGPRTEGASSELFRQIRALINQGEIREAELKLRAMDVSLQNAEWHYLMGCVFIRRGYFLDGLRFFDTACQMDPSNAEYAAAREQLRAQTATYGGGYRTSDSTGCGCDLCTTLICADCCCDCMGGDLIPCC